MIIFALAACFYSMNGEQCGTVYDHVHKYENMKACEMQNKKFMESLDESYVEAAVENKFDLRTACIDWPDHKPIAQLPGYIKMITAIQKMENA